MIHRLLIVAFLVFVPSVSGANAQGTAVDDTAGAIQFIESLAAETEAIWSDATLSTEDRKVAFHALFSDAADVRLLAKAMLGRHYRSASVSQRKAYLDAMETYVVNEIDSYMGQIGFRELLVRGTTPASGRQGHLFVRTLVEREDGDAILADWRIRKRNDQFHIVNLEIEGINMVLTNRERFSARVSEIGLDGLIAELRGDDGTNSAGSR